MRTEILEEDQIFVIHSFFSKEACARFIEQSEQAGYDEAPISTSAGFVMKKEVRDNTRVILDDGALAKELWDLGKSFIPNTIGRWQAVGLNERFRFYRYDPGQKFAPHYDGAFCRSDVEQSLLTFMIYLNDGCEGGETNFYLPTGTVHVQPACGKALVFVHRLLHEGAPVLRGRKYVLRTDVMYRRCGS